jgi:hypothetical protein
VGPFRTRRQVELASKILALATGRRELSNEDGPTLTGKTLEPRSYLSVDERALWKCSLALIRATHDYHLAVNHGELLAIRQEPLREMAQQFLEVLSMGAPAQMDDWLRRWGERFGVVGS